MKIYTKTGDDGTTSLFDGSRVSKANPRVDLYGEIDELNALIGLANSFVEDNELKGCLHQVQKDLFALGAKFANPNEKKQKDKTDFDEAKIKWLESQIDTMEKSLPRMTSFILPGGTNAAGALHLARCVCRRAERKCVHILDQEHISKLYLKYLNRLSDFLFVIARFANFIEDEEDIPW